MPSRLFANCISILTIRGKFSIFLVSVYKPKVDYNLSFFVDFSRRAVRMGQHFWLLLATIITELLVITKWSQGQFPAPFPITVKWGWAIGATLLVLYPIVQVSFSRSIHPFIFVPFLFFFLSLVCVTLHVIMPIDS